MLTGLISPTSGEANIMGKNVAFDMSEIRKDLGVCPQHDILYPDLTVREHLRLFGTFKGVAKETLNSEIDKMIAEVGLVEKANTQSSQLSGGMKRKLSVAIAFIGGSKTVLLDEPTSGME
jgi:ATP-binding cassette subfamily A (ABC1) protein 3